MAKSLASASFTLAARAARNSSSSTSCAFLGPASLRGRFRPSGARLPSARPSNGSNLRRPAAAASSSSGGGNDLTSVLETNQLLESELVTGAVQSYDQNWHPANDPVEDSHAQAVLPHRPDCMLFAVVDGHAGRECGQVVAARLFSYVAAGLLGPRRLALHLEARRRGDEADENYEVVRQTVGRELRLPEHVQQVYEDNYQRYLKDLVHTQAGAAGEEGGGGEEEEEGEKSAQEIHDYLERAFVSLDEDISQEACMLIQGNKDPFLRKVGLTGAVAALALVDRGNLYVASTGDCSVVLGTLSENETWVATKLSADHSPENPSEWKRICSEHPGERGDVVFTNGRLCGVLMPTRAFGDFKLKWPADRIRRFFGAKHVLKNYRTPPYLTAKPEVTHHVLKPRDKFLIIASDGLWDQMTPMQVIRLLGEHLHGKVVLTPLPVQYSEEVKLKDILQQLRDRQEAMKLKPDDAIGATHLLRYALGSSSQGIDYGRLKTVLGLPVGSARRGIHDDITVTVVYFDFDYIRKQKGARGVDLFPGQSLENEQDKVKDRLPREEKMHSE